MAAAAELDSSWLLSSTEPKIKTKADVPDVTEPAASLGLPEAVLLGF